MGVGYNAQAAVDAKHKLIVEQEVTNAGRDLGQLAPTAIPAKEALGLETIQATADRGYFQGEDIARVRDRGHHRLRAQAARTRSSRHQGLVPPRRRSLTTQQPTPTAAPTARPCGRARIGSKTATGWSFTTMKLLANRCPIKAQCTSAKRWRQIARWEGETVLDAMAARLAANPQMTRLRRNTVEHPFGTIKHAMNQGHFLMKGLRQVRAEFSLSTLAYNLLRVINIVGVKALVEALRRRWRALAYALQRAHGFRGWFYARMFARIVRREQNLVAAGLLA